MAQILAKDPEQFAAGDARCQHNVCEQTISAVEPPADRRPLLLDIVDELPSIVVDPTPEQLSTLFWVAVAVSVILPRLPLGRQMMYPFALLGTWVHEMGHGLAAVVVGGRFRRLEIYSNLGGQALSSGVWGARRAIVSAGGLLGPALAGGLIIVTGSRQETAGWVLTALAVAIALSLLAYVRNLFGLLALGAIAAVLTPVALYAPEGLRIFLAQLIGIQFCLAFWGTLDYMFTKKFVRNGRLFDSDTQEIANVLLLPYWFWAALITLLSVSLLVGAFYLAWMLPTSGQ